MAELVDALDLGSSDVTIVGVRLPLPAPKFIVFSPFFQLAGKLTLTQLIEVRILGGEHKHS